MKALRIALVALLMAASLLLLFSEPTPETTLREVFWMKITALLLGAASCRLIRIWTQTRKI